MLLSDLKPGTDYDILVEARANHQNQKDAWDPHDPYLCKQQGPISTFRTGHPPIPPTEFSVIGGTTKSMKLAWNEPIVRGVKVQKFLLVVSGPGNSGFNFTNGSDSLTSTPRSSKGRSKKHIITSNNNYGEIVPRVYEVPADTVIYEVKNLVERTEYIVTLHMVTPHSDAEKVKQLYESPESVNTVENDIWTPYVTAKGVTAGIDPPEHLHVTERDSNVLRVEWKPAKAYGVYNLLYNVIRWNEVDREQGECMSTRDKIPSLSSRKVGAMRVEADVSDACIQNFYPGVHYEIQVEACFGVNIESEKVSEIALTNRVSAWSRAPPARPKLLLTSISREEFELSWDRPVLLDLGMWLFFTNSLSISINFII